MPKILAKHSYYLIQDVDRVPRSVLELLDEFDLVCHRHKGIGYFYDSENKELRIPHGFPEKVIRAIFTNHEFIIDKKCNKVIRTNMTLTAPPKSSNQLKALGFLCGTGGFSYTKDYQKLFLDLETGEGKTYCGIGYQCFKQVKTVILLPPSKKVLNQWVSSYKKFTDISKNELLVVKGGKTCDDIIDGKHNDVKTFIMTRRAILAFVKRYNNEWSVLDTLFEAMGVGLKIQDEAHTDMSTMVNIECNTNVKHTLFLTSSPDRSGQKEKIIYRNIFKEIPRFGRELRDTSVKRVIGLNVMFTSKPSSSWIKKINPNPRRGMSQFEYEKYLMSESGGKSEFVNAFLYTMFTQMSYRQNGGKFLIMSASVAMCEFLQETVNKFFPTLTTSLYVGNNSNKDNELDRDVIFATSKGFGIGAEFPDHQFTINVMAYSSSVSADQIPGRNREIEIDSTKITSIYSEIVNVGYDKVCKQYKTRIPFLRSKMKNDKMLEVTPTNSDYIKIFEYLSKSIYPDTYGFLYNFRLNNYVLSTRRNR